MIEFVSYLKIFYKNKKTELHNKSAVKIEYSCLEEPRVQELKQYLVAISNCANRSDGQDSFLSRARAEINLVRFMINESRAKERLVRR